MSDSDDVSGRCRADNKSVSQCVIPYEGNHKAVMLQMQKNPLTVPGFL